MHPPGPRGGVRAGASGPGALRGRGPRAEESIGLMINRNPVPEDLTEPRAGDINPSVLVASKAANKKICSRTARDAATKPYLEPTPPIEIFKSA